MADLNDPSQEYPLLPKREPSPLGPLALEMISWRFLESIMPAEPSMLSLSQIGGGFPSSSPASLLVFCFFTWWSTKDSDLEACVGTGAERRWVSY